jgi:hypothetical protein
MNLRLMLRIQALEAASGADPRGTPPIEFFDRMLDGRATEQEWARWTPWLMQNLRGLSDEQVERLANATGMCLLPEDKYL